MLKDVKDSVALAGWVTKWQNDPARKNPYRIKPGQTLRILVTPSLEGQPFNGLYIVDPDGNVVLGPEYGKLHVARLTIDQATDALRKHLTSLIKDPKVSVAPGGWENDWHAFGEEEARPSARPSEVPKINRDASHDGSKDFNPWRTELQINRDALRYGGKDFNRWRRELLTELRPDTRVEGLKALSAFGANGYAAEATKSVLEMMRGYDIEKMDRDDEKVVGAGLEALKKIGPAAVPELRKAMKGDNRHARDFAVAGLGQLGPDAKEALPDLMKMVRDKDPDLRMSALSAVVAIDRNTKGIVQALIPALYDPARRGLALSSLIQLNLPPANGPEAKELVPALIAALGDKDVNIRNGVVSLLRPYGAQAQKAIPVLIKILKEESLSGDTANPIAEILGAIGPAAKEAVPALQRWQGSQKVQEALKRITGK
jgi:HEAT repeat protein